MVFKGTQNYADGQIAKEVEQNGGYLNAFTSYDQTGYVVDLPADSLEKGLEVLKEMAFLPDFTAEHLQSEKEVIVAELKRGLDSPGNVLFTMMSEAMFQGSSYEHPIIGFENTIRNLSVEDLHNYRKQWYQPQSMVLVVCGNIDLDSAQQRIIEMFGGFSNTQTISPPDRTTRPKTSPSVKIETGPWQKVRVALAFPAPPLTDDNAVYLDLLSHILGGDQTSYLYKKYKYDKRLVDAITVNNYSFEESGILFVMATLDSQNLLPFWTELTDDLQNGFSITDKDLAKAQLALKDSFYRSKETLEGVAAQIGHFQFYHNGEKEADNYLTTIDSATATILQRLYNTVLRPQQAGIFAIIPQSMELDSKQKEKLENDLLAELQRNWPTPESDQQMTAAATAITPERIDLPNGNTIILYPDSTLPYIAATLTFKGGESLLTKENQGLGAFTASLLTRGTASRSFNEIQTFLADRAASLTASSNRQSFRLNLFCPNQYASDVFKLLNEIISTPKFLPEEAERVKENMQASIVRSEEQPLSLVFRHLGAFLYPGHPYGNLHMGTPDTVKSFTASQAQSLWETQRAHRWTLSVCGDFSREELLHFAHQLPDGSDSAIALPTPELTRQKELTLTLADREQAHLLVVFPTPGISAPDEAVLEVLTNIMAGQSGLLFTELRDKQGLGYSVTAFPWKAQKAGALILYIGTSPERLDAAYEGFVEVVQTLKDAPLPEPTVQRGKLMMTGDFFRERQTFVARSSEGAMLNTLELPLDFKVKLIDKAQQVSPAEIQSTAQKYLNFDESFVIKVLPQIAK